MLDWTVQSIPVPNLSALPSSPLEQRTQRMLEAASALFLERGYAVNMAEVARRAGVSKQTVYSHFGTKEQLFQTAVQQLMRPMQELLGNEQGDLRTLLTSFATQHLARSLDPHTVALSRRLVAEASRFPAAAAALFEAGPDAVRMWLAERLSAAAARGEVDLRALAGDSGMAAEILLGMLNGLDGDRRRLGLPVRSELPRQRWIEAVIELFLAAVARPLPSGNKS